MPAEFYWRPYVPIKEKYRTPDGERGNVRVALPTQAEIKYLKHARRLRISFLPLLFSSPLHPTLYQPRFLFSTPFYIFDAPFFFFSFLSPHPPPPLFFFIPRLLIRRYEIGCCYVSVKGIRRNEGGRSRGSSGKKG